MFYASLHDLWMHCILLSGILVCTFMTCIHVLFYFSASFIRLLHIWNGSKFDFP